MVLSPDLDRYLGAALGVVGAVSAFAREAQTNEHPEDCRFDFFRCAHVLNIASAIWIATLFFKKRAFPTR
jgi:hypothetical protein